MYFQSTISNLCTYFVLYVHTSMNNFKIDQVNVQISSQKAFFMWPLHSKPPLLRHFFFSFFWGWGEAIHVLIRFMANNCYAAKPSWIALNVYQAPKSGTFLYDGGVTSVVYSELHIGEKDRLGFLKNSIIEFCHINFKYFYR